MRSSAVRIDLFSYLFLGRYLCPPRVIFPACFDQEKLSELVLDTFRMLQCLEGEPSGSSYQSPRTKIAASAPISTDHSQGIVDHTSPTNLRTHQVSDGNYSDDGAGS
ncbi:hypothetical protein ACJRO7_020623 [Eucalyptus globulus]|uniref:Uncharacterized protein n=1 Tax=Eucalyptus globulus TaxID=34317 RepID=A0ABD3KH34_EUCGL